MAITDINISEQLQTDAPSIKYSGNEGPQNPQQPQEIQIAQQIWEALGPEQQGQFQSFEQFFQSGIWKQILQQMQQDEAQGIGSLGPIKVLLVLWSELQLTQKLKMLMGYL